MGMLEGKVAFITGAARGQGRSHALRLAAEGADIIAIDRCEDVETIAYPMADRRDLAETARLVETLDRRCITAVVDVRDFGELKNALDSAVSELGQLNIVSANAGILGFGKTEELSEESWREMIDINLTGVWHTVKAAIPHLRAAGPGGSIILTSSTGGVMGLENLAHYNAAKHGVIGLMRTMAHELAPEFIRVNTVVPTMVNSDMTQNPLIFEKFAPELSPEERTPEVVWPRFAALNAMPINWIEAEDVSNAVAWLASDKARYVTGINLPVDAGATIL